MAGSVTPRRSPGRPRVIDRARIVEAARHLDPETITMQSVADEIGVGRKTLHYHVKDRDELVRIVAADTLRSNLSAQPTVHTDDWRLAIRSFAASMRDAIVASGRWFDYVRLDGNESLVQLESAEVALGALEAHGFSPDQAAHALGLVAEFTLTSARDALARQHRPHHPQSDELKRVLGDATEVPLVGLKRLAAREWDEFGGERQFEFDVTVVIYGLERLLAEGQNTD